MRPNNTVDMCECVYMRVCVPAGDWYVCVYTCVCSVSMYPQVTGMCVY